MIAKPPLPEGCMVLLRSGGPMMTTEKTRTNNLVSVMWFDGNGVLHRDCLHFDALIVVGMPCKPPDDVDILEIAKDVAYKRRQQESDDILNASSE